MLEGDKIAELLLNAISAKNWSLVTILAVVLIVWLVRKYGSKYFPVLGSAWAGVALSFLLSVGGAVVTAVIAGQALTFALFASAIITALASMGTWSGTKAIAESAGYAAENSVKTGKDAAKVIAGK